MHNLFYDLEPRQLLAATHTGIDTDGDQWTIKVTGPGDVIIDATPGTDFAIANLALTGGPTVATKISITVKKQGGGDGRLRIKDVQISTDIAAFSAPTTDLAQSAYFNAGIRAIAQLVIGNFSLGAGMNLGAINSATFGTMAQSTGVQLGSASTTISSLKIGDCSAFAGPVFTINAPVTKVSGGAVFGMMVLSQGVKDLSIAKDSAFNLILGGTTDINSIVSKGTLALNGTIATKVKKLSAKSLTLNNTVQGVGAITATTGGIEGTFNALGRVDKLTAKGLLQGTFTAPSWGSITAASIANATINYSAASPSGFVINSIKAGAVTNTLIGNAGAIVGNLVIKSIDVASWSGGTIQADALDTLKAKGNFSAIIDLFNGAGRPTSIKSATIGGDLSGEFRLASVLTSLKAASTGAGSETFTILKANNPVAITKLELTGTVPSFITVFAKTIGTFKAKGFLAGALNISDSNTAAIGLTSLSARELSVTINAANTGIGSITTKRLHNFEINAAFIKSVAVTAGSGLSGEVENGSLTLSGANTDGLSLKSFSAKGPMFNALVRTASNIGTFTVNTFIQCGLYAGLATNEVSFPETLAGFDPAARIGSFTVKAPFSNTPSFANSTIVAATIDKVLINGRIDPTGSVVGLFGFGAKLYGTFSAKDLNGAVVNLPVSTVPNDYQWFVGSDNFRVRVYA